MESLKADMEIVEKVAAEHPEKLQKIG